MRIFEKRNRDYLQDGHPRCSLSRLIAWDGMESGIYLTEINVPIVGKGWLKQKAKLHDEVRGVRKKYQLNIRHPPYHAHYNNII